MGVPYFKRYTVRDTPTRLALRAATQSRRVESMSQNLGGGPKGGRRGEL